MRGTNLRVVVVLLLVALAGLATPVERGFRTGNLLRDHYQAHGREFGKITIDQYLHMAQQLRDSKPGRNILMSRRPDGGGAKFDKRRGWFVAYDGDGTIRNFFIPRDGIRHFDRHAKGIEQE